MQLKPDVGRSILSQLLDDGGERLFVTVAQLVEHGTHKPRVAGSIPARDTIV